MQNGFISRSLDPAHFAKHKTKLTKQNKIPPKQFLSFYYLCEFVFIFATVFPKVFLHQYFVISNFLLFSFGFYFLYNDMPFMSFIYILHMNCRTSVTSFEFSVYNLCILVNQLLRVEYLSTTYNPLCLISNTVLCIHFSLDSLQHSFRYGITMLQ